MTNLAVQPLDAKTIRISGIDPLLADCLYELPDILEQRDKPAARARLFPDPTHNDAQANADWQRLIQPDLHHLLASAGEIVARDLTTLQLESPDTDSLCATFPAEHVNAWMSALNQARLILGELFHIEEHDMNEPLVDLHSPKARAVLKIHVLGYLLQLFVELQGTDE